MNEDVKVGIVIQARMGSARLPGKPLAPLAGKPLVHRCFDQCRQSKSAPICVVAIPTGTEDDPLAEYLEREQIPFFRGDPVHLVRRYLECARHFGIDTVVRVTGDNPVVDPAVIDLVVARHFSEHGDYTSTRHWTGSSFVGLYPKGLSVDVFATRWLEKMLTADLREDEAEHIVPYFGHRSSELKLVKLAQNC